VTTAGVAGLAILLAWPVALPAADAADALADLEARLARAGRIAFSFSTTSEGAFGSAFEGRAFLGPERIELAADGRFGGEPASVTLLEQESRLAGGNGGLSFDEPAPAATREALVVGWIRMGILHNLARLTAGQPPDHAQGGAEDWVTLHELRWGSTGTRMGRPARALEFGIRVSGEDSGEATLWIAEDDGLPVEREQTVRFPGGEMRVVERYRDVGVADP
jgi:hypothetical protein